MFDLQKIVRKNILDLKPYSSARDEFSGENAVFLDANENPFGDLNRYPDPHQKVLKSRISNIKNIPAENIFLGNGSDEVIDILYRMFCNPGQDEVILCPPTYGMYEVSANINNVKIKNIPLNSDFQLDIDSILKQKSEYSKLIFICSPNNPSGNSLLNITTILENFDGIVVVDEAYIDFSNQPSFLKILHPFPNLIVMQTLSKAWGLAAVRIGMAFASAEIISLMNKVKPPYNISKINQEAALQTLKNEEYFNKNRTEILTQRDWLIQELLSMNLVKKIYPSDANFLLIEVENATEIYTKLVFKNVIVRNRSSVVRNTLRITVGTSKENQKLIEELKKL